MMTDNFRRAALSVLLAASIGAIPLAQRPDQPVRSVADPGVITTRQTITPAGVQSVFDGRVYGLTFGEKDDDLWVLAQRNGGGANVFGLDWLQNRVKSHWEIQASSSLQGLVLDPLRGGPLVGLTLPARAVNNRAGGVVRLLRVEGKSLVPLASDLGTYLGGHAAAAATADGGRVVVPLIHDDQIAIVNLTTGALLGKVKTNGVAPFGAVISRDGRTAWVTNWGGRWPEKGDPTLPTGTALDADRVVVDGRGIAATGTVARIDLERLAVTASVEVG